MQQTYIPMPYDTVPVIVPPPHGLLPWRGSLLSLQLQQTKSRTNQTEQSNFPDGCKLSMQSRIRSKAVPVSSTSLPLSHQDEFEINSWGSALAICQFTVESKCSFFSVYR